MKIPIFDENTQNWENGYSAENAQVYFTFLPLSQKLIAMQTRIRPFLTAYEKSF